MICKKCGRQIADNVSFCNYCGEKVTAEPENTYSAPVNNVSFNSSSAINGNNYGNTVPSYSVPQQSYQNNYSAMPAQPGYSQPINENNIPQQYKPVSAWGYFGYQLLFCIPLVGLICLIIFSLSNENINRRNFARSYWCIFALAIIIGIIVGVVIAATGGVVYSYF